MKDRMMVNLFFLSSSGLRKLGFLLLWPAQLALVLLTFHFGPLAAEPSDSERHLSEGGRGHELMDSREVQAQIYRLFENADCGNNPHKCSLWVTSENDRYSFIPWSKSLEANKQAWHGAAPSRAVAIIRISQTSESEEPSRQDHALVDSKSSKKTRMSLYVVHRNGIWKVVPDMKEAIRVRDSHWLQEFACAEHLGLAYGGKTEQCGLNLSGRARR